MTGASRHEAPPQRPATSTPGRLLRRIAALLLLVYALGYAAIRLSGVIRLSDGVIAGRVQPTMETTVAPDVATTLFTVFRPCVHAEFWVLEWLL